MKLIIQIPCFNEEAVIAATIADIPREIRGISTVEILIVDDGSTDATAKAARDAGADHIVRHRANRGLAASFSSGLDASLRLGADVIVNTDADNQYRGLNIPLLIAPILKGDADIVIGDRQPAISPHFSFIKRRLQLLGSWVVSKLAGTSCPDAVSGFRAFSRAAALKVNVVSSFSYTIETIIQAVNNHAALVCVPVSTNPPERPSRLVRSISQFVVRSTSTAIRSFAMYKPLSVFIPLGGLLMLIGAVPVFGFLLLYIQGHGDGHVQSLVVGSMLLLMGILAWMMGLLADLSAANRRLLEITLEKVRRIELNQSTTENSSFVTYLQRTGLHEEEYIAQRDLVKHANSAGIGAAQ